MLLLAVAGIGYLTFLLMLIGRVLGKKETEEAQNLYEALLASPKETKEKEERGRIEVNGNTEPDSAFNPVEHDVTRDVGTNIASEQLW